jgi:NAD(P)-dependent dehydrogenase (short-subunit alcohol dehydrogenase family)
VINPASQLGKSRSRPGAVFSGATAGVIAIPLAMAREHAREGVRVHAICPATFDTAPATCAFIAAGSARVSLEAMRESYAREPIRLGRVGSDDPWPALSWPATTHR